MNAKIQILPLSRIVGVNEALEAQTLVYLKTKELRPHNYWDYTVQEKTFSLEVIIYSNQCLVLNNHCD